MSVAGVIGIITFKKLFGSRNDDWIDKLNHAYTVSILIVLGIIITTSQFVGDPIQCWTPAEFTGAYEAYAKSYCWIKNTYYIPMNDMIAVDIAYRQNAEITYYQWTPLILLFMACLFKMPNILWKILQGQTGLNFNKITAIADKYICSSPDDRKTLLSHLSIFMDIWLKSHHYHHHNFITRAKARVSRVLVCWCNKKEGKYITAVYLTIKMCYVANVIGQFYMLSAFLGMDYNSLGYRVLDGLAASENWRESPTFPRVTLCDFKIRQLQNTLSYTIQCVLPINLFNEKIFIILWFWLFILAILSTLNFAKWMYLLVIKKNNYQFVKKYLKISEKVKSDAEKKMCRRFADYYLRDDGCFVLRMIAQNATDMVIVDLLDIMWEEFKKTRKQSVEKEHSFDDMQQADIPYIDTE